MCCVVFMDHKTSNNVISVFLETNIYATDVLYRANTIFFTMIR